MMRDLGKSSENLKADKPPSPNSAENVPKTQEAHDPSGVKGFPEKARAPIMVCDNNLG
jgi:hypothetical protein